MDKKRFTMNFLALMVSMFVLFIMAVGLAEPAGQMLKYMNDVTKTHSPVEWAVFIPWAILGTAMWCAMWLTAKRSEKTCVDELSKKQRGRKK